MQRSENSNLNNELTMRVEEHERSKADFTRELDRVTAEYESKAIEQKDAYSAIVDKLE